MKGKYNYKMIYSINNKKFKMYNYELKARYY